MEPLLLKGCRHDVFGHYLKALGLLRVLSKCAARDHLDPEAEGWWHMGEACFVLRSDKYGTMEKLVEFFEKHYRPTPVFSAWNTGGGMDEKKEVAFRIDLKPWHDYWVTNKEALIVHGFPPPTDDASPAFPERPFELKCEPCSLSSTEDIQATIISGKGKRPKAKVQIDWSKVARSRFFDQMDAKRDILERGINFTDAVKRKFQSDSSEFVFDVRDETALTGLAIPGVQIDIRAKETGKKAVMALLATELSSDDEAITALNLGRKFFQRFQAENADDRMLLEEYREQSPASAVEAFDAIFTTRAPTKPVNNPVFLKRGYAGAVEIFRSFWVFFRKVRAEARANVRASLDGIIDQDAPILTGKGPPYFPDTVKSYNIGLSWVEEEFPFCPLDYVLAVEGAFALRGSVARAIGANSKRFAAFPFVFDGGEDLVNKDGKITDTASNLWLPLWDRCVTYGELASFIEDAQARLPGKDVRFSAEFVRALHAQGVDAGFSGWQEFRFKLRGSDVPWTTTGPYTDGTVGRQRGSRPNATLLNVALAPLDDSRFLDQFDIAQMGKKLDPRNPRSVLGEVNEAMETAALEPTPDNCLALLESVFSSCRRMCISKSFREKLRGERASFFPPLPMEAWNDLLNPLDQRAEFRVARALASITGLQQQGNGDYSSVQPMLGSLLPVLKSGRSGWYLPENNERRQYVWTGENLLCDLAAVLRRRYLDSRDDEFPALRAVYGARLDDVLAFLRGELDDRLIARWTEALSLIGWQFTKDGANEVPSTPDESSGNSEFESMEPAYAALRTLLELECECQGNDRRQWKKRRSQQPLALLCERSASSLPLAVSEAFRWISIWGVPNAWGAASRAEKARISGEYVVRLDHWNISTALYTQQLADRLAAAVCIPLQWQDRRQLHRAVTIPPGI